MDSERKNSVLSNNNFQTYKDYLESRLLWSNKETVPSIEILSVNESIDTFTIIHNVNFNKIGEKEQYRYFSNISCMVLKTLFQEFLRDKNLNSILNDQNTYHNSPNV